jgi:hypothetical protein
MTSAPSSYCQTRGAGETFLLEGLKRQVEDDGVELAEFDAGEEAKHLKKHLAKNVTAVPSKHGVGLPLIVPRHTSTWEPSKRKRKRKLRQSAYVVWDLARGFPNRGILRNEWDPDPGLVLNPEEYDRRGREMQECFNE